MADSPGMTLCCFLHWLTIDDRHWTADRIA